MSALFSFMRFPSVFRHRAYAMMWTGRLLTTIATLAQSVAIGWLVYTVARRTYDEQQSMFLVGMIGLAQFLPMFALALIAGETADRYDRRKILLCCGILQVSCAAAFTLLSMQAHPPLIAIFVVAGFFGIGRTFSMPAGASLVPLLVPIDELPKAIAWNTFSVQSGMILGPWIGGVLCGLAPVYANATACALYMLACTAWVVLVKMPLETNPKRSEASRLTMIREGLTHLWGSKIVLGAISLDLFAVLLGGVTALLPAFAKDILFTGPEGFGQLRASFAAGAGCLTLCLASGRSHGMPENGCWAASWSMALPRCVLPFHAIRGCRCWRWPWPEPPIPFPFSCGRIWCRSSPPTRCAEGYPPCRDCSSVRRTSSGNLKVAWLPVSSGLSALQFLAAQVRS